MIGQAASAWVFEDIGHTYGIPMLSAAASRLDTRIWIRSIRMVSERNEDILKVRFDPESEFNYETPGRKD